MDESTSEAKGPGPDAGHRGRRPGRRRHARRACRRGGRSARTPRQRVLRDRRDLHALQRAARGQGLVVDDTVRCPWHHACFSLRTGEALRAPALSPVACWSTELRDGKVFVRTKKEAAAPKAKVSKPGAQTPRSIVIIGGGAAGFAAAERLRREQYEGGIVMLSSDDAPPVDRPNLSKDYLAGSAPEDWIPLRPDSFYPEHGIELRLEDDRQRHRRALRAKWFSPMEARCPTTGCCWRPAPSRSGCHCREWTCRTCTHCARLPIAARSSRGPARRGEQL